MSGKVPNMNEQIRAREVRLIDESGHNVGVISRADALTRALQAGLDLVEISPDAQPPVAKIIDYGKYKYEEKKRQHKAQLAQKTTEVKEIRLGPAIAEHDYQIRLKQARAFLEAGNKVRFSTKLRGREIVHKDLTVTMFKRLAHELDALLEQQPKFEQRQLIMIVAPK